MLSWLFEAMEPGAGAGDDDEEFENEHMQELIDEFQVVYDDNEATCAQTSLEEQSLLTLGSMTRVGAESLANNTASDYNTTTASPPLLRKLANNKSGGIWDPFHRDIQKTIHFWGYMGSLTEPPCAANTLWRIMDVPVKITTEQLYQMQNILFNNRNNATCEYTSTHYKGSVARPIFDTSGSKNPTQYYKCTRSDYVSDAERGECGDDGCANDPSGTDLDPYVEPMIYVTGPPSEHPTMQPSSEEIV